MRYRGTEIEETPDGMETLTHPFEPLYDAESRILILGSFPSVKSREQNFFYGHPQNRFWKVLAAVFEEEEASGNGKESDRSGDAGETKNPVGENSRSGNREGNRGTAANLRVPQFVEEKRDFLHRHHVALWDVIYSCRIRGSSDASIRDAVPTDLSRVIGHSRVGRIFVNGQTAWKLYQKYQAREIALPAMVLPSTSPANAAWSAERLAEAWRVIRDDA